MLYAQYLFVMARENNESELKLKERLKFLIVLSFR